MRRKDAMKMLSELAGTWFLPEVRKALAESDVGML